MWNPTHVQFTVLRARNLVAKGKGGNNDVFATIQLGKEKYQTTTIKKAHNPEWFEECDLSINNKDSEIKVNLFHRGKIADELIGYCIIPLQDYQDYDKQKSHWIILKSKAKKNGIVKDQGELEVCLNFHMVKKDDDFPVLQRRSYTGSLRHLATTMAGRLKRSQSLIHRKEKAKPTLALSNSSKGYDSHRSYQVLDFRSSKDELHMSSKNTGCSKSVDNIFMTQQPLHQQASCTPLTMAYLESKMYRCDDRPHSVANLNERFKKSQYATIDEVLSDNTKAIHKSLENIASTTKDQVLSKSYTLPKNTSASFSALYQTPIAEENGYGKKDITETNNITSAINPNPQKNFTDIVTNGANCVNPSSETSVSYRKAWDQPPRVKLRPSSCIAIGSSDNPQAHLESSVLNDFIKDSASSSIAQPKFKRRQRRIKKYNSYDCDQDADSEPEAEENRVILKKLQEDAFKLNSNNHFNSKISLMHPRNHLGLDSKMNLVGSNSSQREFFDDKETNGLYREQKRTEVDFSSKHPDLHIPGFKKRPISISFDGRLTDYSEILPGYGSDNYLKSEDLVSLYRSMNKEELISRLICQKAQMIRKDQYIRGLESYIDDLLVGVIEQNPKILNRKFNY